MKSEVSKCPIQSQLVSGGALPFFVLGPVFRTEEDISGGEGLESFRHERLEEREINEHDLLTQFVKAKEISEDSSPLIGSLLLLPILHRGGQVSNDTVSS